MARAGLSPDRVVVEAEAIVDGVGLDGLTLSALASRLGVRQPSLYNHIESLNGLHRDIAMNAKRELAGVLSTAAVGKSGADAVVSLAAAYRRWAVEHPGRYATTVRAPAAGDTEDEAAGAAATEVVFAVLAGFGLAGDDVVHETRALRASLHGFADIEAREGFGMPVDVDASFARMVDGIVRGLEAAAAAVESAAASASA